MGISPSVADVGGCDETASAEMNIRGGFGGLWEAGTWPTVIKEPNDGTD